MRTTNHRNRMVGENVHAGLRAELGGPNAKLATEPGYDLALARRAYWHHGKGGFHKGPGSVHRGEGREARKAELERRITGLVEAAGTHNEEVIYILVKSLGITNGGQVATAALGRVCAKNDAEGAKILLENVPGLAGHGYALTEFRWLAEQAGRMEVAQVLKGWGADAIPEAASTGSCPRTHPMHGKMP